MQEMRCDAVKTKLQKVRYDQMNLAKIARMK